MLLMDTVNMLLKNQLMEGLFQSVFQDEYTRPCGVHKYSSNIQLKGMDVLNIRCLNFEKNLKYKYI